MLGFVGGNEGLLMVIAAAVLSFILILSLSLLVAQAMQPRLRLNRRLKDLGLKSGKRDTKANQNLNPRQKRIQEQLQNLELKKKKQGTRSQVRSSMLRAGLEPNVRTYLIGSACLGLFAAVASYLLGMPSYVLVASALVTAYFFPKWFLSTLFNRRQKKFTSHFATGLDVIIRGVRSGLPITECLRIVSREVPDPVGGEFTQLVEGQKLGLTLPELLQRGLERMPTKEYKFFAIVIQIQQETGGNLADTLENLSTVLRERKQMRDKAIALSSEAKSSAAIIGSLPFIVGGGLSAINWEYMSPLATTGLGHTMIYCGLAWMSIGVLVMHKMINFKM